MVSGAKLSPPSSSGLDPTIHGSGEMDPRVKPEDDRKCYDTLSNNHRLGLLIALYSPDKECG